MSIPSGAAGGALATDFDLMAAVAGKTELDAVVAYLQGMGRSAPKGG